MIHLSQQAFNKGINQLVSVFGENGFKPERINRIFKTVADVPDFGFQEIIDGIIDNFKYAPLPKDFHEASVEWHKKFKDKYGYYYHRKNEVIEVTPIRCIACGDFGFLKVTMKESNYISVIRCNCIEGKLCGDEYLPQWESFMYEAFDKERCPLEWFKPKDLKSQVYEEKEYYKFESHIQKQIDYWQEKKKVAAKFWKEFLPQLNKLNNI